MTNVLIVRLSSFGDIVLTEPITRAVKRQYPDAHLWFVTSAPYVGIPLLFQAVDSVVPYSRDGSNPELDTLARSARFDAVIDLQNNLRSRRVTRGMRSAKTAGHRRPRFRRFLSVYMPWLWRGYLDHTVQTYADTAARVGIEAHDLVPGVDVPAPDIEAAIERFGPGPFVGICPGGSSSHKRWSEESFTRVIASLIDAGSRVGLKMNVKKTDLESILKVLPAEKSPTISSLADSDFAAVEVVIEDKVERSLVPALKRAGASGIITYPLNKVIH